MNCTQVEKLLPLYVEGDCASEREADGVRLHLSDCEECGRRLEEWSASQRLLHAHAQPEFDDEFYDRIRANVLSEIRTRAVARPSIFESVRLFFLQRPAMTATLALLLLSGALLFGITRKAATGNDVELVVIENGMGENGLSSLGLSPDVKEGGERAGNGAGARPHLSAFNLNTGTNARRRAKNVDRDSMRQQQSPGSENLSFTALNNARDNAGTGGATLTTTTANTATQAVARMEIQTSDPNIRIIWVARKTSE